MTNKEKCFAILAHGSYLLFGIGYLFLPIILLLLSGGMCDLAKHHIKQAIKAQCFVMILFILTICLSIWFSDIIIMTLSIIIVLVWFVSSIIAMVKAAGGEDFHYPLL
jgi:uncharacterized Tic20 family protein